MSAAERVIFVVPGDDPPQIQGSPHLDRLRPHGDVVVHTDRPATMEEQLERVEDAQVIINTRGTVKWHEGALRSLPKLRMIATCSIGTDMIDLGTTSEIGIVVSNQSGRTAGVVAEHAIGLMFAVAKRAHFQTAELKAGRWTRLENIFLQGKTLGVVGTGHVGGEVARLASAVGMKVVAWTFHPSAERATALGVRFVSLDDLLRRSDVVSLNVMLSDRSKGMISKREIALIRRGLYSSTPAGEGFSTPRLSSRPSTQATWRAPVWMSSTRSPFHQATPSSRAGKWC